MGQFHPVFGALPIKVQYSKLGSLMVGLLLFLFKISGAGGGGTKIVQLNIGTAALLVSDPSLSLSHSLPLSIYLYFYPRATHSASLEV